MRTDSLVTIFLSYQADSATMFDFAGIRRTAEAEGVLVGGWSLKHAIFGSRNDGKFVTCFVRHSS